MKTGHVEGWFSNQWKTFRVSVNKKVSYESKSKALDTFIVNLDNNNAEQSSNLDIVSIGFIGETLDLACKDEFHFYYF